MTPRERFLAAVRHQPVDRIPTDIWATPEIWATLDARYGSREAVYTALHIDGTHGVDARYVGPALPNLPAGETVNYWGIRRRRINYGTGTYDELSHHPLAHARTIDDLEKYAWPSPDWFDYSQMQADIAVNIGRNGGQRVVACGYMAIFFYHNLLRGLEQSLLDPIEDPAFTHHFLNRLSDSFYHHHRRMFEAGGSKIDISQVTDDLGTQTGPMIGLETFRTFYRPHMQRFIDLCHEFGVTVMHHDDGAIRPFLPDLVEMGIDILNPIQWRCPGMEVEGLNRDFGKKICFHGAVDNQHTLPHGTPEEVRAEVRHLIDTLASDGTGYILAPCHNLQPVTPIGNIEAMYDEAYKYGGRR